MSRLGQHHRRSIRLKDYDYTRPGMYFVTICTHDRVCLFGEIADGGARPTAYGRVVAACWEDITVHFPSVEVDAFVVMPNHLHGILLIAPDRVDIAVDTSANFGRPVVGALSTVIRSFKSATTKRINELRGMPGGTLWQRNYYEHIIRDERALESIRRYIEANPARWETDEENPAVTRSQRHSPS